MRTAESEPLPEAAKRTRLVLVVLATVSTTSDGWLFVWAWQLSSPVLVAFGVVCLPMSLVLIYGAVLVCERSDVPGAEQIIRDRRRRRPGWASQTPQPFVRHEPADRQRAHAGG